MAKSSRASERLRTVLAPIPPDLSQEELAKRLGVTRQAVWAWLTGESRPDPQRMAQIEDMLGIPMRDWVEPADADDPTDTTAA